MVFADAVTAPAAETRSRLGDLPERHLAALRAVLAGFADRDIAGLLGIPVESVPTTVRLAAAKLLAVLSDPSRAATDAVATVAIGEAGMVADRDAAVAPVDEAGPQATADVVEVSARDAGDGPVDDAEANMAHPTSTPGSYRSPREPYQ